MDKDVISIHKSTLDPLDKKIFTYSHGYQIPIDHLNPDQPIGVFDSGIGGLTVLKQIWQELPWEKTIYVGDCGRAPYGTKSHETIVSYSKESLDFLLQKQVKMIVIACNSASAHAYEELIKVSPVPIVEVISHGAQKAIEMSPTHKIGLIATGATVESKVYLNRLVEEFKTLYPDRRDADVKIYQQACPLLVSLAEEGWWEHPVTYEVAKEYLLPLQNQNIDCLVLGCTHFPLLRDVFQNILGERVNLIDSGITVAKGVRDILIQADLLRQDRHILGAREEGKEEKQIISPEHQFFTSDDPALFTKLACRFLAEQKDQIKKVQRM